MQETSVDQLSIKELEGLLAQKRAAMEQHQLTDAARIGTLETTPSELAGAILRVELEIEGFPVEAIVDTGAQCTVIS